MLVIALLYGLRRLERWLHQHIFKVGWLITRRLQTTAILYYAFFLPGVVLNQLVYWLAAGFLNVHAEHKFSWPDPQHIGELQLGFIKLAKTAGPLRQAVISLTPFVVGLATVSLIANSILNVQGFIALAGTGFLGDLTAAVRQLTSAPDFWLWFYLAFTISNTMMPHGYQISAWRPILSTLAAGLAILFVIGAGDEVLFNLLSGPVADALNALSGTLAVILGIDIFMVAALGTVEAIIERITGNSATYKDGKLITMRRSDLLAQRAAQTARRTGTKSKSPQSAPGGSPSVYKLQLPLPGAPGSESVTRQAESIIASSPRPSLTPNAPVRNEPSLVVGTATDVRAEPLPRPALRESNSGENDSDFPMDDEESATGTDPLYEDEDESA